MPSAGPRQKTSGGRKGITRRPAMPSAVLRYRTPGRRMRMTRRPSSREANRESTRVVLPEPSGPTIETTGALITAKSATYLRASCETPGASGDGGPPRRVVAEAGGAHLLGLEEVPAVDDDWIDHELP